MDEHIESMKKTELLQQIRDERRALEEVLTRLTNAQMLLPGVDGVWSVKDALAHISAWEQRMLSWIPSHLRGEPPEVPLPWDVERMNSDTYAQVKDKPLAGVLQEFHNSYQESLALVESLTEDQLQTQYLNTWPMGPLWLGVAANTNFHYKEHRNDIEKWLATGKET
jgi:hypothetical protein